MGRCDIHYWGVSRCHRESALLLCLPMCVRAYFWLIEARRIHDRVTAGQAVVAGFQHLRDCVLLCGVRARRVPICGESEHGGH